MSTTLTLIKYNLGIDGRYLEDSGERIASSFISEENLNSLIQKVSLAKLTIYEEDGSDKCSEVDCLHNEEIFEALIVIKKIFIGLLKRADEFVVENSDEKLNEALSEFRSLTNIHYLLEIKHTKYQTDDTAIVKLG